MARWRQCDDVSVGGEGTTTEAQGRRARQSVLAVIRPLWQNYLSRRYTILFYALVFTLVASPVIAAFGLSGALIESFLAAGLLAALMPVSEGKIRGLLVVVMISLWLARPVTAWLGHPTLSEVTLSAWTFIGLFAAVAALRFAMRGTKVDTEQLIISLGTQKTVTLFRSLVRLRVRLEHLSDGALV